MMLVMFTSREGTKLAINADAVAWIEPSIDGKAIIRFSGRVEDCVQVELDYDDCVDKLQDALA